MDKKIVEIEVYDKRMRCYYGLLVEKISDRKFKMIENDILNCRLSLGTEFETRINKEGKHEVVRVLKESEFVTRRFFLSEKFKEAEYRVLGDEIEKQAGFWQVDFGGIVTVNLPADSTLDLDEIFRVFDAQISEITED